MATNKTTLKISLVIIIIVIIILSLLCNSTSATGRGRRTTFRSAAAINVTAEPSLCKLLISNRGYPCEEHTVTTSDGYILSLQRIPFGRSGGRKRTRTRTRTPILLQHGLLSDGVTWLLLPPAQSLAFVLSDNGYDVWIANSRGTKYSRRHVSVTTRDKAYWDWSWDELWKYDLPATVGYIHRKTGQKLHYVGHSMGSLMAFAALSKGQLVNVLRSAVSLCPVGYLGHLTAMISRVGAELFLAEDLYWMRINEFDPKGVDASNLLYKICKVPGVNCEDLFTASTGPNCCLEAASVELYHKYEPQPTSVKNLIHSAQMVRRGTLAMYDYEDEDENMRHYGQRSPPNYELKDIPRDFPLFFSYGGNDGLSDERDVRKLLDVLRGHDHSNGRFMTQYVKSFAHADYFMAGAAKEKVYDVVLSFLRLH